MWLHFYSALSGALGRKGDYKRYSTNPLFSWGIASHGSMVSLKACVRWERDRFGTTERYSAPYSTASLSCVCSKRVDYLLRWRRITKPRMLLYFSLFSSVEVVTVVSLRPKEEIWISPWTDPFSTSFLSLYTRMAIISCAMTYISNRCITSYKKHLVVTWRGGTRLHQAHFKRSKSGSLPILFSRESFSNTSITQVDILWRILLYVFFY